MRLHVVAASFAFPIALIACGGGSPGSPPVSGSGLQPLAAARAIPQNATLAPAASGTSYLYVVDNTTGTIDAYALPMSSSSTIAKTITFTQPTGYTISGITVDTDGHVLYVSSENNANYPPPNQYLYRCITICKEIGTIPGGSGIAIAGSTLYATGGVAAGGGYVTSEILTYAYSATKALGTPSTLYQDGGMDYFPMYDTVAVDSGYLAASGDDFPPLIVCTGITSTPSCSAPSRSPSGELNGAVALNSAHTLFVGLKYYAASGFGEICRLSGGTYGKCTELKSGNQGDQSSTAAVDSSGNFYDIAGGTLYVFKDPTTISLSYPISGSYGPIAVGK
jgi:hypothetical protein